MLVLRAEDEKQVQAMESNRLRTALGKANDKNKELTQQLVLVKGEKRLLNSQVRFRDGFGKHVSSFGGYSLARKRAMGNTGAASCAVMVAGESYQGSVSRGHTVTTFEHRLAVAYRVRDAEQQCFIKENCDKVFIEAKFDSTNSEAVEREKVHASVFCTSAVGGDVEAATREELEGKVTTTKRISGDLIVVKAGTGRESYNMAKKEAARRAVATGASALSSTPRLAIQSTILSICCVFVVLKTNICFV